MENHVWGEVRIIGVIRKTVGAVLGVINTIRNFDYDLKKTNRKAKYNLVLNMYCIGFFCGLLNNDHCRDPPLKFLSKKF